MVLSSSMLSQDKGKSDYVLGLVRSGRNVGLVSHLPGDTSKPQTGFPSPDGPSVDGVGQPLVDIPIEQTNEGKGKDFQLESYIAAITTAKLERIRPSENMDAQDRSGEVLGKRILSGHGLDRPKTPQFQPPDQFKGIEAGDTGACNDNCERDGGSQEPAEGVGMEIDEHDGCSPLI